MDVNGQLHAPEALRPGERPPVSTEKKARLAPEPVWTLWRRENPVITGESNHSSSNVQPLSLSLYRLCYAGHHLSNNWKNK